MKKRLFITASILALASNGALASDDRLEEALKKIADLEAKNKSLSEEVKSLRGEKPRREAKKGQSLTSNDPSPSQPKQYTLLDTNSPQNGSTLVGFYAGVNGGYGGGDVQSFTNTYTVSTNGSAGPWNNSVNNTQNSDRYGGALAGGQIGYNYILANHIFFGAEYDFNWANIANRNSNSQANLGGFKFSDNYYGIFGSSIGSNNQTSLNWLSTARVRAGYQLGSLLPYITGGFAFGEASNNTSGYNAGYQLVISNGTPTTTIVNTLTSGNNSGLLTGWVAGAGIEYSILQNVSLKTEYLYTQLDSVSQNNFAVGFPYSNNNLFFTTGSAGPLGFHQVRFGINYHPHLFENPTIAAKY